MNKAKVFLCSGLFLSLGAGFASAAPFDETKGYMYYAFSNPATLKKPITAPNRPLTIDQSITAIAKASSVNLIADTTSIAGQTLAAPFPATPIARANKWSPTFYSVLEDLCESEQLSNLRYDDATFLLWKRPNVLDAANALIEAGKLTPPNSLPSNLDLANRLEEFSQNSTAWKTLALESQPHTVTDSSFRLGDLPAELRAPLITIFQHSLLRPDWKREQMLSDSFWKNARFLVLFRRAAPNTNARPVPQVYIAGQDENGQPLPFFRLDRQLTLLDERLAVPFYDDAPQGEAVALVQPPHDAPPVIEPPSVYLEAEPTLNVLLSLSMERQSLSAIVAEASKQSGIPLAVEEGVSPRTLTVEVQALPLHKFLGAIARLSGAKWHKSERGYQLQAQPLEKWQQLLLESGEGDFEGYGVESQFTAEQLQPLRDLELAVADEVTPQQMTEQGLPLSALSQDLQQQIQQTMRFAAADALIRSYNNALVFANSDAKVRLWRYGSSEWHVRLLDAANYVSLVNATIRPYPTLPTQDINFPANTE